MKAAEIRAVAVIGAGTMGAGIAGEFARAGCEVRLTDTSREILDRGMRLLRLAQDVLVQAKLLRRRDANAALKRVGPQLLLADACEGAEVLVEAVPEDLALKKRVFAEFDRLCPKRAVLASNTSGLSITKIAAATQRPTRVAGMHFWNPPHVIPLVEVTRGERTSHATARLLMDLARRLGKRPILVRRDVPGFVGNRLQFAVLREALHILAEGIASAEDIDAAMTAGPGLRYALIGPLRTADLGGLDVFDAISRYLFAELNSEKGPSPVLAELVKKGKLGAKSGAGIHAYPPAELKRTLRRRDRVLLEFLKVLKAADRHSHG
jgi:3-hydroxybutyryl-CoA dehydrogenase